MNEKTDRAIPPADDPASAMARWSALARDFGIEHSEPMTREDLGRVFAAALRAMNERADADRYLARALTAEKSLQSALDEKAAADAHGEALHHRLREVEAQAAAMRACLGRVADAVSDLPNGARWAWPDDEIDIAGVVASDAGCALLNERDALRHQRDEGEQREAAATQRAEVAEKAAFGLSAELATLRSEVERLRAFRREVTGF